MKVAVICLVVFGLIAAICAAVLVAALTRGSGPTGPVAAKAEEMVDVLVAAKELQPMSVVDGDSVISKKVPKSQVPEGALLNSVQVVGKVLTDHMIANKPFTKSCFAREGVGVYLASAVPPGKRAMSIMLTDWSGMAGLLYPGSVVDVLVSFKTLGVNGRTNETEVQATTLLQGLQVLAIGSQSIADDEYKDKETGALANRGQINFRMVTLLVDPKQAEILQLAMQSGSISLAMRNPLDSSTEARRLTRAREISPTNAGAISTGSDDPFADAPPAEPTAVRPPSDDEWQTVIIRGKDHETRRFPMPQHNKGEAASDENAKPAAEAAPASDDAAEAAEAVGVGAGA